MTVIQVDWAELKAFAERLGATRHYRYVLVDDRYTTWLADQGVTVMSKFLAADPEGVEFAALIPILLPSPVYDAADA